MAWLGEGFTSLRGQLTSLAKGVLAPDQLQEGEDDGSTANKSVKSAGIVAASSSSPAPSTSSGTSHSSGLNDNAVWNEALQSSDKFLGQDVNDWSGGGTPTPAVLQAGREDVSVSQPTTSLSQVEKDVASLIPKGIANFFHINTNETVKTPPQSSSANKLARGEGSSSDSPAASTSGPKTVGGGAAGNESADDHQLRTLQEANRRLTQQNASLTAEVASLARMVQDLESQVAVSQDENANLSTGLEELDIQHQQAIEQILVVKDETQKQYEILKNEYKELKDSYDEIVKSKEKLKHVSPLPSITEEECEATPLELSNASVDKLLNELRQRDEELEAVEGENASLRATVKELTAQLDKFNESLPPIQEGAEELEVLETRLQALEQDNRILQEVRTNLEAELQSSKITVHDLKSSLANTEAVAKNMTNLRTESERRNHKLVQELSEENTRLRGVEDELKHREERLNQLETLHAETTRKNRELEKNCQKLSEENTRLNSLQTSQLEENSKLTDAETVIRDLEGHNRKLEEMCNELSEENSRLKSQQDLESVELQSKLSSVETAITDLKSQKQVLEDLYRKVSEENVGLKGVQHKLELREEELKSSRSLLEELKASKTSLELLLQNTKIESSHQKQELEAVCNKLSEENLRLKELEHEWKLHEQNSNLELQSLRSQIDKLNADSEVENCGKDKLEMENTELSRKLSQLKGELNRLDLALARSQQDCQTKDRKMCEILLESTALEEEFKSYKESQESKYQALNVQYCELKDELERERKEAEQLKALGQELENEADLKSRGEIEELNRRNQMLEDNLASVEGENQDLKDQLNSFRLRFEEESKQSDHSQTVETDYEKLLADRSEMENSLRRKIRDLETNLEALDNVAQEYEISKDIFRQKEIEFKNQIQTKDEELVKYGVALREWESSGREIERKMAESNEETQRLKDAAKQMEESLRSYKSEINSLKDGLQETIKELDENKSRLEDASRLNTEMKIQIEGLLADMASQSLEKTRIEEEHRQESIASRQEIERLTASNDDLVRQHSRAVCERDSAIEEVKSLQDKVSGLTDKLSVLLREKESTTAQLAQITASLTAVQAHNSQLDTTLQMKEAELAGHRDQIERLHTLLTAEREKLEKFVVEKVEFNNRYEQLSQQFNEKNLRLESVEAQSDRQLGMLKQEVESLRNQLEYASQLLRVVDRQEAEGQSDVNGQQKLCPNGCAQTQEEVSRLSGNLINEQTTNKLLRNQVDELAEKYSKAESKLSTLKQHLVEVEENYSGELTTARDKINDLQSKLAQVDERLRSSSTAYTSASIRANQQVESLTLQVKSVTEQKERLENELSKAEDNLQRQVAALTNLQAVLHQFQRDKQKDVDFETERIRQTLAESNNRNKELASEIKQLTEQLNEAKKGLGAATRLSEQLDRKSETISTLKKQVNELMEKLKLEEGKVAAAHNNIEGKVDRCLVKNLVVGYLTAPAKNRELVLNVISTVLEMNKEDRQKVGLEAGAPPHHHHQPSLSQAFIHFLESESQPKPQLLLPLAQSQISQEWGSRKTSVSSTGSLLLAGEPPQLTTALGRNPASILKDVLNDRNS